MRKLLLITTLICCLGTPLFAQSFSLQEAIDYALENSSTLERSKKDVDIALLNKREAIATGLPQLNFNASYQNAFKQQVSVLPARLVNPDAPEGSTVELPFGTQHTANAGFSVNQLLFSMGYLVALKTAGVYNKFAEIKHEKSEQEIKAATISSYGNVLAADKLISYLNSDLKIATDNLGQAKESYKIGLGEKQSVEQFDISVNQLKSQLFQAQNNKKIALQVLNYIIGLPIENETVLTTDMFTLIEKLSAIEIQENPEEFTDLKLAFVDLKLTELSSEYNKANAYPTLSLFASFDYQGFNNDFGTFFKKEQSWNPVGVWGAQLQVPIFNGGTLKTQYQKALLELDKKQNEFEDVQKQITQKLNQQKLELESALENQKKSKKILDLSESIYKKERIKFKEGLSSSLSLNNAEKQKVDAQSNVINSIFNVIEKYNSILKTTGSY